MRCFIAIDIDQTLQKQLILLQEKLRSQLDFRKGDVKWVDPQQIHLTLKFLGEVADNQLTEICSITEKAAAGHDSFEIEVGRVGYFGKDAAKILWVGAGETSRALQTLQNDIESGFEGTPWPRENRPFTAHLTLCRVKNNTAGRKIAKLSAQYSQIKLGTVLINAVYIYQSQLTSAGPVYTVLHKIQLRS